MARKPKDTDVASTTTETRGGVKFVQLRNRSGEVVAEGSGYDERTARVRAKVSHAGGRYGRLR